MKSKLFRPAQVLPIAVTLGILTAPSPADAGSSSSVSASEAQEILKEGNERFVSGRLMHPHLDRQRRFNTAKGQNPFVTIIGCSDSRVPIETVFDQGIGDTFIIRVAGNVCDTDQIASIEYGAEHLGTQLVMVLGHEGCGAVTAVVEGAELDGSLPALLDNIEPAVAESRRIHPRLKGKDLVPFAVRSNVMQAIEDLLTNSPGVHKLADQGKVQVVGAVYELETGKVRWLGEHPNLGSILKNPPKDPQHAGGDASKGHDHAGGNH